MTLFELKAQSGAIEAKVKGGELEAYVSPYPFEGRAAAFPDEADAQFFPDDRKAVVGVVEQIPARDTMWVNRFVPGVPHPNFGGPAFPDELASHHSLWSGTFGSPTLAQNYLAILDGSRVVNGHSREIIENSLSFPGLPSLETSYVSEAGFHADAQLRLHVQAMAVVRGGGGAGGEGGCNDGAGKTNEERMGGGGGGAGAQSFHLTDPGERIGGRGGLNSCNFLAGPNGVAGTRELGGLGNNSVIGSSSTVSVGGPGEAGRTGIILRKSMAILNEGRISGGGGGGGGAETDGFDDKTFPGNGGDAGLPGFKATIRSGAPDPTRIYPGGAAGKAVDLNGFAVTWLADLDGTIGTPGDVRGQVS